MKRLLCVLLCTLVFLLNLFIPIRVNASSIELKIQELIDQRTEAVLNNDEEKIQIIEKRLQKLGVEFLKSSDVLKKFSNNNITPYVDIPSSNNVTWLSSRFNVNYGGKLYEVQRLYALANTQPSKLKQVGAKEVFANYQWEAGLMNGLSVIVQAGIGEIPGVSTFLTVYDLIKDTYSGLSKTTVLSGTSIKYQWSYVSTVVFSYVKIAGTQDSTQFLSYVSTKGNSQITAIGSGFANINGTIKPCNLNATVSKEYIPINYADNTCAVRAYLDATTPRYAYVYSVGITGIEGTSVAFYPYLPEYPIDLY